MHSRLTLVRLALSAGLLAGLSMLGSGPAAATMPGNNGLIVFTSDELGQLFTVRPDGTGLRQITNVDGAAVNPDWSPDGKRIVFEWDHANEADGQSLAFIDRDGGHLTVLPPTLPNCALEGQPSYTPDGKRIVFERYDCAADDSIFSRAIDGSDLRRVTTAGLNGHTDPNVSPTGRRISIVDLKGGVEFQQALVTFDRHGNRRRVLMPYSADIAIKQDWSPDGKRLLFSRDANPTPEAPIFDANLGTIGANGKGLKMLTHFTGGRFSAFAGSYSPDGDWVVFRLVDQQDGGSGLWKMHPDGSHKTLILAKDGLTARYIDWGPRS